MMKLLSIARLSDDELADLLAHALKQTQVRPCSEEHGALWRAIVRALVELTDLRVLVVEQLVQPGRNLYPMDIDERKSMGYLSGAQVAAARGLTGRDIQTGLALTRGGAPERGE